jgi:ribosome biogenesis GTPase
MRELGLIAVGDTIDQSFADIYDLAGRCRFADCSHTVELGCAVLGAVERGELSQERYHSYLKLMKESAFHEMSYAERRRKEKQFGRMIKTAMEQLKKRKPSSF